MTKFKAFALVSCVGLLSASLALADEWNKKTILTVNEAIQVPNKVLQPGKYVMKLLDSPSNRHIVQIFDENEQHLITTILAIPNYRLQPTGDTHFGFWETPAGQAKALRSWFYPGDNFGQEFAYPKSEAMQIAASAKTNVPTTYAQSESDLGTARVGQVNPSGQESELPAQTAQAMPKEEPNTADRAAPAPEPAPAPAPEPTTAAATPEPAQAPAELPKTGSELPLLGLVGLIALGGYGVLKVAEKRS